MVQYVNGMSHPRVIAMPGHNIAFSGQHLQYLPSCLFHIVTSFSFAYMHLLLAINSIAVRLVSFHVIDFFLYPVLAFLIGIPSKKYRCFRLKKECQPSVPNRKRNPRKAPGSRTAHLEEKLDDLVSLIRAQASGKAPGGNDAATTNFTNSASPAAQTGPATGPSTMSSSEPSPNTASTAPFSRGESSRTEATSTPENGILNPEFYCTAHSLPPS